MDKLLTTSPLDIHLQWFGESDNSDDGGDVSADAGADHPGEGAGDEIDEFLKDLPEPLQQSKSLAKFKGPKAKESLAQSYVELEGKLGRSVEIPGKDAKPEAWEKYFSRTGRPKTADEYKLIPYVGHKQDPVFDAAFKAKAHSRGLSAEVAADLYLTVTQRLVEDKTAQEAQTVRARESALQELKTKLGDKYDSALALAKRTYASIFSPESQAVLHAAHLDDDPRIAADLAKHGALFGTDHLLEGDPPGGGDGKHLDTKDPKHPYGYMRE